MKEFMKERNFGQLVIQRFDGNRPFFYIKYSVTFR